MKITPNLRKHALQFLVCTALSLTLFSCKKDKNPSSTILGEWYEKLPASTERHIHFYGDSVKFLIIDYSKPAVTPTTELKGTFIVKGDHLNINITETVSRENNKVISRAPFTGKIYENATFTVNDDKLTLNYTSYPADAPVASTTIFKRILPD